MSTRILLIEDDERLAKLTAEYLRKNEFEVTIEGRGDTAEARILKEDPELVILDIMLPGKDGFEVCRAIRSQYKGVILMLTARDEDLDQILGLELGADDYIAKPVQPRLLLARIKALLRRRGNFAPLVHVGRLAFDTTARVASVEGKTLSLTPRELAVLEALVSRLGKPVARHVLFEKIFSFDDEARPEAIEIYVHRLRKKLEGTGASVATLRGLGYVLSEISNG